MQLKFETNIRTSIYIMQLNSNLLFFKIIYKKQLFFKTHKKIRLVLLNVFSGIFKFIQLFTMRFYDVLKLRRKVGTIHAYVEIKYFLFHLLWPFSNHSCTSQCLQKICSILTLNHSFHPSKF